MEGEKRVCFELKVVSNLIKRHINNSECIRSIENITGTHAWALGYLYKNRDKDVFQRDIEEKFSVRRSTVTNILQLMEKNGVIKREPVEHDARLKKIVLTQKGIDAHLMLEQELKETEKIQLKYLELLKSL